MVTQANGGVPRVLVVDDEAMLAARGLGDGHG